MKVALERVAELLCSGHVSQFKSGVVVKSEVLGDGVAEQLFALDVEDLYAEAARCVWYIGGNYEWERRVSHDAVMGTWFGEHGLGQMSRQVGFDGEFAFYTLGGKLVGGNRSRQVTYTLCL